MAKDSNSWVVYRDENGVEWTRGNIKDLIEAMQSLKKLLRILKHYNHRL